MDAAALLRQAREAARLSQGQVAAAAGTTRQAVSRLELGLVSPNLLTLSRLLAACGVQARMTLEPLMADVDARLDAMLATAAVLTPEVLADLELAAGSLDDDPTTPWTGFGRRPERKGPVRWAFDGGMALRLHGLAVAPLRATNDLELVAVLDDALRSWLFASMTQARDARGYAYGSWLGGEPEDIKDVLQRGIHGVLGFFVVRVVDELPATVGLLAVEGGRRLPVLTVDEVERGHPAHAEVLARWRERRTTGGRTVGG
jgi:transcriptional regulator with XRE-family HTH domain